MSQEEVRKQVEYYLSDENLSKDQFFHEQISKSDGGYLGLHLILKCNKMKKLGVTEEKQLADAIEGSQVVELNESKTSVRRKGEKSLPELQVEPNHKKVRLNNGEGEEAENGHAKEKIDNPYENLEPIIFTLKGPEGVQVTWGQISEALMKQYNISCPYIRFGKTEGNFALNKNRTPQENVDKLVSNGVKVGDHTVEITVTEGDKLKEFWAHHGKHYEGIIKRNREQFSGKPSREQKKLTQKGRGGKGGEITFHNQKYKDINQLKNIFKTILARSENGAPLKEPYHSMLLELLQYHDKKDKKLNDLKHFTVGQHPEHPETRCFMVVKNDGTQEDFSAVKCIQNLQESLGH